MFPEGRILDFVIVGVVALIVVGPKDLPMLMRKVGQFVARMRAMAAEFRASFDEIARQSELDELRREVEAMRAGQVFQSAPSLGGEADQVFEDIHAELDPAQPNLPLLDPAQPGLPFERPSHVAPGAAPPVPEEGEEETSHPVKAAS